jgi:hypothetical protein
MPSTRPAGLMHLLPGEQSVSKKHASVCTSDEINAEMASANAVLALTALPLVRILE